MTTAVEFGGKDAADAVREEFLGALCSDDDRRKKVVTFSSDAPEAVVEDAQRRADQSRGDQEAGPGQVDLTDHERDRLDFSKGRANVPHAQSVKAIARSEGVDDWTAHYDATLSVDEHREVMERAAREGGGRRLDEETSATERAGEAAAQAEAEECDHARAYCKNGDPEACEFLTECCGVAQSEVEEFLAADEDGDLSGEQLGAIKRAWDGYQGATGRIEQAIKQLDEEWQHAQQAARAVNAIRAEHDQGPLHFERLEDLQGRLTDLTRQAAADCHECHAAHEGHDHPVTSGAREHIQQFVKEGGAATPVGTEGAAGTEGATDQEVRQAVEATTEAES